MASDDEAGKSQSFEDAFGQMLEQLALRFPVCTASDEFHFFPQVPPGRDHWSRWDDFSSDGITGVCAQLTEWKRLIKSFEARDQPAAHQIDLRLMRRIIQTLDEQLTLVAVHECQPTFYLTIMGIGLAEAMDAGPQAFQQRLRGLPLFLEQALNNLKRVPRIFNRLGQAMAGRLLAWLGSLPDGGDAIAPVLASLERLRSHLQQIPTRASFLLPVDVYLRIAADHIGCHATLDELAYELDREIADTEKRLSYYADRVDDGRSWQSVVDGLKPQDAAIDPERHYRRAIDALARHCIAQGLIPSTFPVRCPVEVETIPAYMMPVRSNAAFSAAPGHPARGGTFFIMNHSAGRAVPADYRLLSAHETYPGHHLLDSCRWNLDRPLRRHFEFPLFYEGWASFSEELLFDTGFFEGPVDNLLMAKRRFWRALRGRVDFNINTGHQDLAAAAGFLCAHGMDPNRARAMVERYILKPGYQLTYTIGRRRFHRLYELFSSSNKAVDFMRLVLSQGEIEFDQLETIIKQGG